MAVRIIAESARVKVPATSANLGPGYDALGLALGIYDQLTARAIAGPTTVRIEGQGAEDLPRDDSHLVIRAIRAGLDYAGASQCGIDLHCVNRIPQARGMGSSAAAVVGGLLIARQLISAPEILSDDAVLHLATSFEGHPDNAAPAIYGGATIAWMEPNIDPASAPDPAANPAAPAADQAAPAAPVNPAAQRGVPMRPRAVSIELGPHISPTILVPRTRLETSQARAALPEMIPHADAAFAVGRSALLIHALRADAGLLMAGTEDSLHQHYRAQVMPEAYEVMTVLRHAGWPAVISGAGPSVVVLEELDPATRQILATRGWSAFTPGVGKAAHQC